jgi:hypothetical protein
MWVEEVKDKVRGVSEALSTQFGDAVVRVAFVGYSDYNTDTPPKSRTVYRNFGGVFLLVSNICTGRGLYGIHREGVEAEV